jgi:hypothetical protein
VPIAQDAEIIRREIAHEGAKRARGPLLQISDAQAGLEHRLRRRGLPACDIPDLQHVHLDAFDRLGGLGRSSVATGAACGSYENG